MKKIVLFLVVMGFLYAQEIYDGIAIVVKNEPITLLDIKKEMQSAHVDVNKAVDMLIRQKLEAAEIKERGIHVSSSEVYDDIKKMAQRNRMSISDFYDAVRDANGLSSTELKEKIRQKLLSQKLYSAIAYASVDEPTQKEIQEYYRLHKDTFLHPSAFHVVIYDAKDKALLQEKIDNPMFYSPEIASNEQTLPYDRISPELAKLLERTKIHSFTPVIPNGRGGFMSMYIKSVESAKEAGVQSVQNQIINQIMAEKRELILGNYFAKLRDSADINIIRLPQ